MRRRTLSIAMFLLLTISPCLAEDWHWGGSIGATYWVPDWEHDRYGFTSDTNGLLGPVAFLHYGNIGIGLQYYSGKFDLTFPDSSEDLNADRTDMDLMVSYRVAKILQISLLYKEITFDWNQLYRVETSVKGLGIGAGLNQIFPNRFMIYGFGFYMPDLDHTQSIAQGPDYEYDSNGYWMEAGLGYMIPEAHLLIKAGYRYQRIAIQVEELDYTELSRGTRAEISYFF